MRANCNCLLYYWLYGDMILVHQYHLKLEKPRRKLIFFEQPHFVPDFSSHRNCKALFKKEVALFKMKSQNDQR